MAPAAAYSSVLLRLINYLDSVTHPKGTEIPRERITRLTPSDLMRFFNSEIFGAEVRPEDGNPKIRSSTVEFWKKALSSFMTNRLMAWNEVSNIGNPTRCTELNDLVKYVKKKEVRKQGVSSKARRALTHEEFKATISTIKAHNRTQDGESTSVIWNYGVPASMCLQFHVISRIDDTMHIKMENLRKSNTFSFLLQVRLNWSKNVREERDAPWQILLPAMNSQYCVYINIALWLEVFIEVCPHAENTPFLFGFSADVRDPQGAITNKNIIQDILGGNVFKAANSQVGEGVGQHGPLGTHSIRKLASTHSRRSGATKDERDIRGRWKGKGRVADVYDDVELPWPDVKVASMLCVGGPCKYVLNQGIDGIDEEFVLNFVAPNIRKRVGDEAAVILGNALLYAIFNISDDTNNVPPNILNRVRAAYSDLVSDPSISPVTRVPVVCTGNEGEVYIDAILTEDQDNPEVGNQQGNTGNPGGGNPGGLSDRPLRDQLRALQSQMMSLKGVLEEIDKRVETNHMREIRQIQSLNANIKRIAAAPARPIQRTVVPNTISSLSSCPRTVYELWDEYTVGVGGRKPAREFTAHERG